MLPPLQLSLRVVCIPFCFLTGLLLFQRPKAREHPAGFSGKPLPGSNGIKIVPNVSEPRTDLDQENRCLIFEPAGWAAPSFVAMGGD